MSVDTSGLEDQLRQLARDTIDRAADEFVDRLKHRCPVSDDGDDHMVDTIERGPVEETGTVFSSHIQVPKEHASFTNEGTDPHQIFGRPWLAWDGPDGRVILNASQTPVNHPGTTGTHWWDDTVDEWPEIIAEAAG